MRTMAQLSTEEKVKIAHLQRALWKLQDAQNEVGNAMGTDYSHITRNIEETVAHINVEIDEIWDKE